MAPKLYANLVSQPSRAAEWVMRVKQLNHELAVTEFGSSTFTSDAFLQMNPNGLIPVLQDGNFSLFEGHAIMVYLAEKHGWTDLYPTDLEARAKVNQYLHWHHTNARHITSKVLVPVMHTKQNVATTEEGELVKASHELVTKLANLIERFLVKDFIAESDVPTLADFACYCEMVQIEYMGAYDFDNHPKLKAWLARMKDVPFHDEVHVELNDFLNSMGLKTKKTAA